MVYSAACLIYCLFEDDPKDKHKKWLPAFLLFACAAITYVYVFVWKNPLVHEVFYGFMILSIVVKAYLLAREHDDVRLPVFPFLATLLMFVPCPVENKIHLYSHLLFLHVHVCPRLGPLEH